VRASDGESERLLNVADVRLIVFDESIGERVGSSLPVVNGETVMGASEVGVDTGTDVLEDSGVLEILGLVVEQVVLSTDVTAKTGGVASDASTTTPLTVAIIPRSIDPLHSYVKYFGQFNQKSS
jgi:hypothetical protein